MPEFFRELGIAGKGAEAGVEMDAALENPVRLHGSHLLLPLAVVGAAPVQQQKKAFNMDLEELGSDKNLQYPPLDP